MRDVELISGVADARTSTRNAEQIPIWIAKFDDLEGVGTTKAEALRSLASEFERRGHAE